MDARVIMPSPPPEYNFVSACSSPYITAPSSPSRFGSSSFFSAPASPTRAAPADGGSIHFYWEEKPEIPKDTQNDDVEDFEFEFSGSFQRFSVSDADELFAGGKIKTLKPPPKFQVGENSTVESPKSPAKFLIKALSPKHKKKDFDPFAEALKQTKKQSKTEEQERERGRERNYASSSPTRRGKGSRSLSPLRVFDILSGDGSKKPDFPSNPNSENKTSLFSLSFPNSAWKWYKNWRLKDFLLFRSASEGRKDEIRNDSVENCSNLMKNLKEDVKNSSFRSTESSGSGSVSVLRRKSSLSAHETHYTENRAVQDEMKRKTPLPYKHGLMMGMGCLGIEPAVYDLAGRSGCSRRG